MTRTETFNVQIAQETPLVVEAVCPMCGFAGHFTFEDRAPRVILCPCDDGGCDRYYFAKVTLKAVVTTATIND